MHKFLQNFEYEPPVENREKLRPWKRVVVGGMGGSTLSAGLFQMIYSEIFLRTHRSYGMPQLSEEELKDTLFVVSSYSGETEEALSFYKEVLEKNLNLAVLSSGGEVLRLAQENETPYVLLPSGLEARYALGPSFAGLCAIAEAENSLEGEVGNINLESTEGESASLVQEVSEKTPLIVSASGESILSYIWKIFYNETAKEPAFWNVIPEFNHNEMEMFGDSGGSYAVILIPPLEEDEALTRRYEVTKEVLAERRIVVREINIQAKTKNAKILETLLLGVMFAESKALVKGVDPESTPIIKEFKNKLRS